MDDNIKELLDAVKIIKLPRIHDPRGNLTFVESDAQIPFELQRAYWIYDVPAGEERGGHSHHTMWQILVAVGGSFNVNVCDGTNWRTFTLNRPFEGILIPPGIWRTLDNFSSGGVCLSLVSTKFEEADYIRDFEEFKASCKRKRQ
ncbi:MAG: WxcM-like domain-containing protein [Bacteroidales bacterium]|nr:WxcM-like domain-containing protein [Bacteroidales bacterium]